MNAPISEIRRLHRALIGAKSNRDVFLIGGEFRTILAGSSRADRFIEDPQMIHTWAGTYAPKYTDHGTGNQYNLPIEWLLEDFNAPSENLDGPE